MEQNKILFKERLKELRKEKGLSQKEFAEKLGIAVSTYANWEQGRTEPSICDIYNLLSTFEVEANELFSK
ncbi:MAG: helix-turn-helix transcriptional regulator [Clostridia bacterium]|nr:helix-turn-helix transcriptional regulator [Clostridia bacterium]